MAGVYEQLHKLHSTLCVASHRIARDVQHFFLAFSRAVVDDDGRGGTAVHWVVWSAEMRCVTRAVKDRA